MRLHPLPLPTYTASNVLFAVGALAVLSGCQCSDDERPYGGREHQAELVRRVRDRERSSLREQAILVDMMRRGEWRQGCDEVCAGHGLCPIDGGCRAETKGDCAETELCRGMGYCSVSDGKCVVASDQDCRLATICLRYEQCSAKGGRCVQ